MSSKKSSNANLGIAIAALAIGGGALFALSSKTTPPVPIENVPISKQVGVQLRDIAEGIGFGSGGPFQFVQQHTSQIDWDITPASNDNGNIQVNEIVFTDYSGMLLLIDRYDHMNITSIDKDKAVIFEYMEPGYAETIDTIPVTEITSLTVGNELKASHKSAYQYIRDRYATAITDITTEEREGTQANYNYYHFVFSDVSKLNLEVIVGSNTNRNSVGSYAFEAIGPFGDVILTYRETAFVPFVEPNPRVSIVYGKASAAITIYNNMPDGNKNIVGAYLDSEGSSGGIIHEQDVRGKVVRGRQYDTTIYTAVNPSQPGIAADLVYDNNSTGTYNNFYIVVYLTDNPSVNEEIINTFPDNTIVYDRTKTKAYSMYPNMVYLYMNNDTLFITASEITDQWHTQCSSAGGILNRNANTATKIVYNFDDGSTATLIVWPIPRQFRISMSATVSGIVKDSDYQLYATDFYQVLPALSPLPGQPHSWLASRLKVTDVTQRGIVNNPHPIDTFTRKLILSKNNYKNFISLYGNEVKDAYNKNIVSVPWYAPGNTSITFQTGEIPVSSGHTFTLHYVQYTSDRNKFIMFFKAASFWNGPKELFEIQIITLDPTETPRYNTHGIDDKKPQDYWGLYLAKQLSRSTIYYTSPFYRD